MFSMFGHCKSLDSLPDISKWNISSVTNMYCMFANCKEDLNIPAKFKKIEYMNEKII